jgi:hypothetical protein
MDSSFSFVVYDFSFNTKALPGIGRDQTILVCKTLARPIRQPALARHMPIFEKACKWLVLRILRIYHGATRRRFPSDS